MRRLLRLLGRREPVDRRVGSPRAPGEALLPGLLRRGGPAKVRRLPGADQDEGGQGAGQGLVRRVFRMQGKVLE